MMISLISTMNHLRNQVNYQQLHLNPRKISLQSYRRKNLPKTRRRLMTTIKKFMNRLRKSKAPRKMRRVNQWKTAITMKNQNSKSPLSQYRLKKEVQRKFRSLQKNKWKKRNFMSLFKKRSQLPCQANLFLKHRRTKRKM